MSIGVGRQVDLTDFHRDPSSALLGIGNRVVFRLRSQFGHFAKRVSHRGTPQPSCSARMIAVNIAKLPVNIDQTAKSKSNAG
jgi:hypothetical protein